VPCLVKSQSSTPTDIWDSTPSMTNTNEAQHHWTNTLTGIKLAPCSYFDSLIIVADPPRVVDQNVAREIEMSLEGGILSNPNNKISHRMARSSQRQSNAARKSRESRQAADISKELQLQIGAEAEKRRVSKEQLNAAKGKSGKRGKGDGKSVILSASSSGCVKTARARAGIYFIFSAISVFGPQLC
ncbi:hypothetical protein FB451DRAFT_1020029, partial [Mycena latifolia]